MRLGAAKDEEIAPSLAQAPARNFGLTRCLPVQYAKFKSTETDGFFGKNQYKALMLNLTDLVCDYLEQLSEEETHDFLTSIGMDKKITHIVMDRLTGDDYKNWMGDDWERRLAILAKMQDKLESEIDWNLVNKLKIDQFIKDARSHEPLYRKMFHDPLHKDFFRAWLERNNIESNYTTHTADE